MGKFKIIILDTHIWIWWVDNNSRLTQRQRELINLNLDIIVASTQLIGFHRDPADQLIVATSQVYNCSLLTADKKILAYPHVQTLI